MINEINDVEEAVIGALLIDNRSQQAFMPLVRVEQFTGHINQTIVSTVLDMAQKHLKIDTITLSVELAKRHDNEKYNWAYTLIGITAKVASTAHTEYHIHLLNEEASKRRLKTAANLAAQKAQEWSGTAQDFYNSTVEELNNALLLITGNSDVTMEAAAADTIEQIEKVMNGQEVGVKSSLNDLNEIFGSYRAGNLYVFGARPGTGKTVFAISEALHAARYHKRVRVVSTEMTAMELMVRIISNYMEINGYRLRTGQISEAELTEVKKNVAYIEKLPLVVDESTRLNDILLNAKADYNRYGCDLLIVDYLQRIGHTAKNRTRDDEVGQIAKAFKDLAKELKIPVILLSQLNRDSEKRGNKRPTLADLRESGNIEQEADMAALLFRPEHHRIDQWETGESCTNEAEIDIAKHRHGSTGRIRCGFYGEFSKFVNLTEKRLRDLGQQNNDLPY